MREVYKNLYDAVLNYVNNEANFITELQITESILNTNIDLWLPEPLKNPTKENCRLYLSRYNLYYHLF